MYIGDPALIGGFYDVVERTFAAPNVGDELLAANPSRVAILWGCVPNTTWAWVTTAPELGLNAGFLIPDRATLQMLFSQLGPAVGRRWVCNGTGPGCNLNVIEVLLRRPPQAGG